MDAARPVVVQARSADGACPYCRAELAPGEKVLVCEGCAVAYHEECMRQELGRCATLGCPGKRALPRTALDPTPAPPVIRVAPRATTPAPAAGARWGLLLLGLLVTAAGVAAVPLALRHQPDLVGVGLLVAVVGLGMLLAGVASLSSTPAAAGRCPACARGFEHGDRVLCCDGCAGTYHPPCLRQAGRCLRPGCTGRRASPARA